MSHLCHLLKISVKPWNSNLSMSRHMSNTCKAAYIQIMHINSIRHLSHHSCNPNPRCMLSCPVSVRLLNSLLSGCPQRLLDKFKKVQNAATRLVCKARKSDHIHTVHETLHWLPVKYRIQHKISKFQLSASIPSLEQPLIVCPTSFNLIVQQDSYDLHSIHEPLSPLV